PAGSLSLPPCWLSLSPSRLALSLSLPAGSLSPSRLALSLSCRVMALVVENTFTAIPCMAQMMFPGASHLPLFFFKNKFMSNREIRKVRAPALFLSGLSDQLIPSRMMMELYQACSSPLKHIETFQGGTHNGTWTCYGYYDHINRFTSYVSYDMYL
ncbi:Protein ABHD13, partial [Geodia barretti]